MKVMAYADDVTQLIKNTEEFRCISKQFKTYVLIISPEYTVYHQNLCTLKRFVSGNNFSTRCKKTKQTMHKIHMEQK